MKKTYIRDTKGTLWGRPGTGQESKYLLTGLTRCACCGGNITTLGGSNGHGCWRKPAYRYGCSFRHNRGVTVCSNDIKVPMAELDNRIIKAIEQQVLNPDYLGYTLDKIMERVIERQQDNPDRPAQVQQELRQLHKELDRFMTLIASGRTPERVLQEIADREQRIQALEQELSELQVQVPMEIDRKWLRKAASERLGRFSELIHVTYQLPDRRCASCWRSLCGSSRWNWTGREPIGSPARQRSEPCLPGTIYDWRPQGEATLSPSYARRPM